MDDYKTPGMYSYSIDNEDVEYDEDYFDIVINPGYVTVNKKVIEINLPSITYDYTEEETASEIILDAIYGLEVGEATINPSYISDMGDYKQPGTYSYTIDESDVTYESRYYELLINAGYVTVNKKVINIDLPSFTYDYTEEETASDKIVSAIDGLEIGEATINVSYINGMNDYKHPGTYSYVISTSNVTYENRYYEVVINPGYVTVTKQRIEVNLPSISYEYDTSITASDVVVDVIDGMSINDYLDISVSYINGLNSSKSVGSYSYTINLSNINGYNSNLHEIVINPGVVTVTKNNIYISVPSVVYSMSSFDSCENVISTAIDSVLSSCDPEDVVNYNISVLADYLTEGTYSLARYVTFSLTDTKNYNLIISSYGTVTVVA